MWYVRSPCTYKLLFLGHRSLIKNKTQTAVINIVNKRILINLTFRMLVNIHFQKYKPLQCLKTVYIIYNTSKGLEQRLRKTFFNSNLILRTVRPEKLQIKKQQDLTANVNIQRWL